VCSIAYLCDCVQYDSSQYDSSQCDSAQYDSSHRDSAQYDSSHCDSANHYSGFRLICADEVFAYLCHSVTRAVVLG